MMDATCKQCRYWRKGYRLHSLKVPDFCDRHFHSQRGDALACAQFENIDTRSIQHPPYSHPGDVA